MRAPLSDSVFQFISTLGSDPTTWILYFISKLLSFGLPQRTDTVILKLNIQFYRC